MLKLITLAGDHMNDYVWYRTIKLITNQEDLQVHILLPRSWPEDPKKKKPLGVLLINENVGQLCIRVVVFIITLNTLSSSSQTRVVGVPPIFNLFMPLIF